MDFDCVQAWELLQHLRILAERRTWHMSKGMREKVRLVLAMSRRAKLYLEPAGAALIGIELGLCTGLFVFTSWLLSGV